MNKLQALRFIAIQNNKGLVDDSILAKACESYQILTGEDANNIIKSILIGQQKVVDGITYIYQATPGTQSPFGWRVHHNPTKKKKIKQELSGENFPTDLSNIKVVSSLGGSTGAKLVEDTVTGKKYVMKKGTSAEHVEEEYLTNQLYNIFGVKTPDFELYNKGTKNPTLLSTYMDNTEDILNSSNFDSKHKEKITEHFVVDCLLSNWDVYKNDNILLNKDNNTLYRVDNGGGLRFSAQGRDKGAAFADTVDELQSLIANNMAMTDSLTTPEIKKQIKLLLKKKDVALKFIEENSDSALLFKMKRRFHSLSLFAGEESVADTMDDPSRSFTDEEIELFYKNSGNSFSNSDKNGSVFMQLMTHHRGWNLTPTVLDVKEFNKYLNDESKCTLVHRGMTSYKGVLAVDLMKTFIDGECFYGGINGAIYGIGIYSGINEKGSLKNLNNDKGYKTALDYANNDVNHIIDMIIPADSKTIDSKLLDDMMRAEFFGPEFKQKHEEYMVALDVMNKLEEDVRNIGEVIEKEVKNDMHWNEDLLELVNSPTSEIYAESIEIPEEIEEDEEAVETFIKKRNQELWDNTTSAFTKEITSIPGAEFKKITDTLYEVKLPHSKEIYKLNKFVLERSNKQKNNLYKPYNWHLQMLEEFIIDNHYSIINEVIKKEKNSNDKIAKIVNAHNDQQKIVNNISNEINTTKQKGGNPGISQILSEIAKHPGGEYRGFYAAIKGYDAIIETTDSRCKMAVILNRAMLKVKEIKKPSK